MPSPLREQLAHAIRGALSAFAAGERDAMIAYARKHLADPSPELAAVIACVLIDDEPPPAEAIQRAQERFCELGNDGAVESAESIRARLGDSRQNRLPVAAAALADAVLPLVEAGAEAERLRLHTQLRDQADAAAEVLDYWATRNGAFAVSSVKRANRESAREAWLAALDRALLGVAATPQHETLIRDIALLGEPPGFDATCSCGWRGAIGCITRAQAEAQAAEHLAGVAATPQPEEQ